MSLFKQAFITTALLASMILAALSLSGCAPAKGEGFAIYLTAHDTTASEIGTMGHRELAGTPIISLSDIVSYSASTHEIELTPGAYERVETLEVPVSGKAFAVCVDGQPIYWGAFWTPISSLSFDEVTILLFKGSESRIIGLELGYPESPEFFRGEDPRSDARILKSLKQAGKLR
jgi:hypothetical protein